MLQSYYFLGQKFVLQPYYNIAQSATIKTPHTIYNVFYDKLHSYMFYIAINEKIVGSEIIQHHFLIFQIFVLANLFDQVLPVNSLFGKKRIMYAPPLLQFFLVKCPNPYKE